MVISPGAFWVETLYRHEEECREVGERLCTRGNGQSTSNKKREAWGVEEESVTDMERQRCGTITERQDGRGRIEIEMDLVCAGWKGICTVNSRVKGANVMKMVLNAKDATL